MLKINHVSDNVKKIDMPEKLKSCYPKQLLINGSLYLFGTFNKDGQAVYYKKDWLYN